ncbi:MAG: MarC family protein [Thermodesulfovibrionia bacterium]|nr:MarC family protein [Thermodesulfovibrionia bacterium]
MWEILKVLPNTFIPLFVAIDVTATLPIFLSLTHTMNDTEKRSVIRQSTLTALLVSLVFVVVGETVFSILGITVDDFKIAGGLILLVLAILELMKDGEEAKRPTGAIGVVPIGVPLIVGPAVLTTLIVLINHYGIVPTTLSLLLNFIIVWLAFTNAQKITKIFGKNGIAAISKIMALLLAAIAVMMIRLGVEGILK